jgi:hypothetical protein
VELARRLYYQLEDERPMDFPRLQGIKDDLFVTLNGRIRMPEITGLKGGSDDYR